MNRAIFGYLLASCLAPSVLADLPQCTTNPADTRNKCGGVYCTQYSECQSEVCSTNNFCGDCKNDETATFGKCEGLSCSQGQDCLLSTCYNGKCDFYGVIEDGFKLVGWMIVWVVVLPIICVTACIVTCVVCCVKSRNRRLQQTLVVYHTN